MTRQTPDTSIEETSQVIQYIANIADEVATSSVDDSTRGTNDGSIIHQKLQEHEFTLHLKLLTLKQTD